MMDVCFVDFAGRIVFLGKGDDAQQPSESEFKGVGYYWKCRNQRRFIWQKPIFEACNYVFIFGFEIARMEEENLKQAPLFVTLCFRCHDGLGN